ncbi:MAG: ArsB/NhaD family transporter [Gammaproteobacteria bacterium]|nr:ArsB/NhaD family transporter [Gammaproteobacteria bacterium]MDH3373256.1 ArsB/NhaD family transporter [Gammaproteobacteria bacterium]MDH3409299.1 ArsB/NhaD family transporter [Gammaproteobacteria bacterium]
MNAPGDFSSMWIASAILVGAYVMIFSERLHRTYAALAGAVAMVGVGGWLGFYSEMDALISIDANTILLLMGMMLLVAMLRATGLFEYLAIRLAKAAGGRPMRLMIYLGVAVSVLSMFLDNVTTVIIFAPLTILVTRMLQLNPAPFLIAQAMLSNIGGAATLVGDPPNIMIGSAASIDFLTFLINMAPLVAAPWLATVLLLLIFFRKDLRPVGSEPALVDLDENKAIREPKMLRRMLLVMGLVFILFFAHHRLGFYPAFVTLIGLALALLLVRPHADKLVDEVDWSILLFFASLFVIVGGVEATGLLELIGSELAEAARDPQMLLITALTLMWIAAMLSALIDNIPFTVTMIPIISALSAEGVDVYPLWWALALGVALGGNGTHIGATANIVVVAQAERSGVAGAKITPLQWLKTGLPVMLSGLLVASVAFALIY